MNSTFKIAALSFGLCLTASAGAFADVYHTADFTVGVYGGNANQQTPFVGVVAPYPAGGTFTGSLVYDQNLIPGPGTGFVNVYFSSLPDIGQIPAATALSFQLGSLPAFTLADAAVQFGTQEAAIQYNNGAFSGLFYISDFTYQGNPYELQIQGASLSIVPIVGGEPTFTDLVNGFAGGPLSNDQAYALPVTATPLPAALPLFAGGLGVIGLLARRRKRQAQAIAA